MKDLHESYDRKCERIAELEAALQNARRAMICSVTGISDGITIYQVREWIAQADAALTGTKPDDIDRTPKTSIGRYGTVLPTERKP